ncbi:hypothetical protein [uncultured Roseobacter sp.]|uniref:hypothetical protein n=1 Tax=uncultured Roseobacter sp. TaxID=114847 RepID=UPI002626B428|nr:hypothetical protein [uncultured Roseobacter sp.]
MSERAIIESQMEKKINEIQSLEEKLKAAKVYVKALEDVLKAIEKGGGESSDGEVTLRKGSLVARARDVILERGAPIHIDDLLETLGREVNRETKASLTGSIAAYVRKEEIFTRPAPSTFGLIELDHNEVEDEEEAPPQGFGRMPSRDLDDEIPF